VCLLSLLAARRRLYEIFLKLHILLTLTILVFLWAHVGIEKRLGTLCVVIASTLWAMQSLVWLLLMVYRNWGSRSCNVEVRRTVHEGAEAQALQLWIRPKRPWNVLPGQYVYLTIPKFARQSFGLLQAHPYHIAWVVNGFGKDLDTIVLLVEVRKGFSNDLHFVRPGTSALIDGPYGGIFTLDQYDKVLFLVSGIGIAAHLLHVRHLLVAHDRQSARVRRISLVWFIEASGTTYSQHESYVR